MTELGCIDQTDVINLIEFTLENQNQLSSQSLKVITPFLRNTEKEVKAKHMKVPIEAYETTIEFIQADIEKYRK